MEEEIILKIFKSALQEAMFEKVLLPGVPVGSLRLEPLKNVHGRWVFFLSVPKTVKNVDKLQAHLLKSVSSVSGIENVDVTISYIED